MGWDSFGVVGFDLRPLLPGQTKRFGMVNHPKFFGWESFGMVRFDLWTPSWSNEDIAFILFL